MKALLAHFDTLAGTAAYLVVLWIYVGRMTAATSGILAIAPVARAFGSCWRNRKLSNGKQRSLRELIGLLQPFDLTILLRGVLFGIAGAIFGGAAFIALDVRYFERYAQTPADICVAITWTLWSVACVSFAAAFSASPRAKYRGAAFFALSGLLLVAIGGRLG